MESLTFIPQTHFRVAPHTTGVVTTANKVYDTASQEIFDTPEEWCEAKGVSVDAIAPLSINGFNYPPNAPWSRWPRYCLQIIRDCTPQLLCLETVKNAYNAFVAVCESYRDNLEFTVVYGAEKYDIREFSWAAYSHNPYTKIPGFVLPRTLPNRADIEADLSAAHRSLCDLVLPSLTPHLEKLGAIKTTIDGTCRRLKEIEGLLTHRNSAHPAVERALAELTSAIEAINSIRGGPDI